MMRIYNNYVYRIFLNYHYRGYPNDDVTQAVNPVSIYTILASGYPGIYNSWLALSDAQFASTLLTI